MKYRILNKKELTKDLFSAFIRRQDVTKCWRKISGEWEIKDIPFIDDWNESEYEELIRLRAEITYIKAENEVIKKEIALREEREAALLKVKKQQSSKNSKKKDIC